MRPKTILVCLTTLEHADTLMRVAVPLARKHSAHLIGLHTLESLLIYPNIAMHIPDPSFEAFNNSQNTVTNQIKDVFTQHTENEGFYCECRILPAGAVSAAERMVESARAADLVIMSQEDKDADRYDQRHVQVQVIKECGRPVIIVPLDYEGPEIGKNAILGWSDAREAARAAHDLISVVNGDAKLTVLRVGRVPMDTLKDFEGVDITETFARHGLDATLEHRDPAGADIADVLNQVAFEKGADLIISGAFGHSRVYDFVIGATTHALLKKSKLPVMFSK